MNSMDLFKVFRSKVNFKKATTLISDDQNLVNLIYIQKEPDPSTM